jgi:hypothetical protein
MKLDEVYCGTKCSCLEDTKFIRSESRDLEKRGIQIFHTFCSKSVADVCRVGSCKYVLLLCYGLIVFHLEYAKIN